MLRSAARSSSSLKASTTGTDTVPSSRFATQTSPAPTATASGPSPTGIVAKELALVELAARDGRVM